MFVQNIHQMHRDHVPTVPSSCHLLASTSTCYNQGYIRYAPATSSAKAKDIQVFTLQGHPEFTASISNLVIAARTSTGVLSEAIAKDGEKRNDQLKNDGVPVVGKVIWQILGVA
jgi:GMP synthase-like glutamine amidotransferase